MIDEMSAKSRRPLSNERVTVQLSGVRPKRLPLRGRYSVLEPLDSELHANGLFNAGHKGGSNETIWTYLPYGPFADVKEMQRWLRECAISLDPLWFAVRETEKDRLIGMASFMEIRPQIGVGEIGHIWFGCRFHKSRVVTNALFSMIRHIFSDCHYRRLEWKCDALNKPSRDAALRLGFRYEGTFYNHKIVKGRNRDTAWYSIIDTEWSPLLNNFEQWLNPANFDESARQRSSLGQMNRSLWLHT